MNAILVDVTRCRGCERCVAACELSSIVPLSDGRFARQSCMHCLEPSCVSACLVGALSKTPEGAVVYDPEKCIGCRYCMLACPFHVPSYEWDETRPFVRKCSMCIDRIRDGERPKCVEACPHDALSFGPRAALLDEAHRRIATPGASYLSRVWGERELGGTGVLYISDVDLAAIGWPATSAEAIPRLTEPLVHATPFIGFGVLTAMAGLGWIVKRRMELAAHGDDAEEAGR